MTELLEEKATRVAWIDRLRGVAIVSMVVDHVASVLLYVLGVPGPWLVLRLTVGRLAFPVFLVLAGWLLVGRGPSWRRTGDVAFAGVVATAVAVAAGVPIGQPDILLLIALVLAVWPVLVRWPLPALCVSIIQPFTWPLPWTGYQPGAVAALALVGWLWGQPGPEWRTLPLVGSELAWVPRWVQWCGRFPLSLYVGHLVVLALVVEVLS